MEMSEILDRAKELATRYEANGYIHRDATLLLPNLVAECEFWQQRAIEEHAALKKLGKAKRERGKALVEERIAGKFSNWIMNQCLHLGIDDEPFCIKLGGPCEYHEGRCPISRDLHMIAREQLRQEGKL